VKGSGSRVRGVWIRRFREMISGKRDQWRSEEERGLQKHKTQKRSVRKKKNPKSKRPYAKIVAN